MHSSLIVPFLVSAFTIAPIVGIWKAHSDARAEGWRLREGATKETVNVFHLHTREGEAA